MRHLKWINVAPHKLSHGEVSYLNFPAVSKNEKEKKRREERVEEKWVWDNKNLPL